MNDSMKEKGSLRSLTMVVHGPEAFDEGWVSWIAERIDIENIIVAGIMARTAAEECKIPVSPDCRPPSQILNDLDPSFSFLLNCAKTKESGERFGSLVFGRCTRPGLVQVECRSQELLLWGERGDDPADFLHSATGFSVKNGRSTLKEKGDIRTIGGCIPGEPVFVNGIIIGYATASVVKLIIDGSTLKGVSGIDIKDHGIEKLSARGTVDLLGAWCKSGRIRRSCPHLSGSTAPDTGRIVVVDHAAVDLYSLLSQDVAGILAIGDDTTAVSGHIGYHLRIPVFGITDGDRDDIVTGAYAAGSVIVQVSPGTDDDTGKMIAARIPHYPVSFASWASEMLLYLKGQGSIVFLEQV